MANVHEFANDQTDYFPFESLVDDDADDISIPFATHQPPTSSSALSPIQVPAAERVSYIRGDL